MKGPQGEEQHGDAPGVVGDPPVLPEGLILYYITL